MKQQEVTKYLSDLFESKKEVYECAVRHNGGHEGTVFICEVGAQLEMLQRILDEVCGVHVDLKRAN